MAAVKVIVIATVITQILCAPQAIIKNPSTLKTPANMSYEELQYIISVRSGQTQVTPKTLSPCARAILGCCKENVMNSYCSESLKCGAFFFDSNPCDDKYMEDALAAAKAFYNQLNKVST